MAELMVYERTVHNLNATNTTNASTIPSAESLEFKTIKVAFYFIIFVFSTFGNIMVAYIICTTRKMRTSSNYLILNLAICDTMTPAISIPFDFGLEENGYVWCYGGFLCKLIWPASTLTNTASALTLAFIALDRYRLIMHPFKPRLTSKVIKVGIVCIYCISLMVVAPYIVVLRLNDGSCGEDWPSFSYRQGYTVLLFMIQYGLPLPFMIVMYALALKNLYKSTRKTSVMKTGMKSSDCTTSTNSLASRLRTKLTYSQIKENEANKKATNMFVVVVLVFTIFMLPNQVIWLWADFGDGLTRPGFEKAMIICWLFTYSNCVFNPIIFTTFSKDFRNGFKSIFSTKCFTKTSRKLSSGTDTSMYLQATTNGIVSVGPTNYLPLNSAETQM